MERIVPGNLLLRGSQPTAVCSRVQICCSSGSCISQNTAVQNFLAQNHGGFRWIHKPHELNLEHRNIRFVKAWSLMSRFELKPIHTRLIAWQLCTEVFRESDHAAVTSHDQSATPFQRHRNANCTNHPCHQLHSFTFFVSKIFIRSGMINETHCKTSVCKSAS